MKDEKEHAMGSWKRRINVEERELLKITKRSPKTSAHKQA
jgi:hypothetical protein